MKVYRILQITLWDESKIEWYLIHQKCKENLFIIKISNPSVSSSIIIFYNNLGLIQKSQKCLIQDLLRVMPSSVINFIYLQSQALCIILYKICSTLSWPPNLVLIKIIFSPSGRCFKIVHLISYVDLCRFVYQ